MIKILIILSIFLSSCLSVKEQNLKSSSFKSQWYRQYDRPWISENFWAFPLEAWQIKNGSILVHKKSDFFKKDYLETLVLLKASIQKNKDFSLSLDIELPKNPSKNISSIIEIGRTSRSDDFRSALLIHYNTGIEIKLDSNQSLSCKNKTINLKNGSNQYTLKIDAKSREQILEIQCFEENTKKLLGKIQVDYKPQKLQGLIALKVKNLSKNENDSFCRFKNFHFSGDAYREEAKRVFGPILWTMHSLNHSILKMNVQMPPISEKDSQTLNLEIQKNSSWQKIKSVKLDPLSYTALFRIDNWDSSKNHLYRISYQNKNKTHYFKGTIKKDPINKEKIVLVNLNCFQSQLFPNRRTVSNIQKLKPDIIFMAGDQIYESNGNNRIIPATNQASKKQIKLSFLNYLGKFSLFAWTFRDLLRNTVSIALVDDHDVYQGNIWGNNGIKIKKKKFKEQQGGYSQHHQWVNAVQKTQMEHNPDPYTQKTLANGIKAYYGSMNYGKISLAFLEDRKFKSPPILVNQWKGRPDHIPLSYKKYYKPENIDLPNLKLLGDTQIQFLKQWVENWKNTDLKCVLSATIFANLATHHGNDKQELLADLDSNSWPQTGSRKAIQIIRKAFAPHIAGDQHLPSIIQYGLKNWNDSSFAFVSPALVTGYPRYWIPNKAQTHKKYKLKHTGQFLDGFQKKVSVFAIANPTGSGRADRFNTNYQELEQDENSFSSGYGIVIFNKKELSYEFHAFPLISNKNKKQFPGWPKKIMLQDNYPLNSKIYLPEITLENFQERPIIKVYNSKNQLLYARKFNQKKIKLPVPQKGSYSVLIQNDQLSKEKKITLSSNTPHKTKSIRF